MATSSSDQPQSSAALPLAAPCRPLATDAPLRWLRLGWRDLRRAPRQSIAYGLVIVLLSYGVSALGYLLGDYILLLSVLSGFVFLGPVLAIGLYSISFQLEQGLKPKLGYCLRQERRHLGDALVFSVGLLIVFLVWARAASMVHVFFPVQAHPQWSDLITFLGIGTAVGSLFAAVIFSASAFSLPMIMDRKVDTVTAVVTSINAVLRNKGPMAVWGGLIVAAVAVGFATAFLGLAVLLPLIGHATWHGYRETIDPSAWPVSTDSR